MRGNDRTTLGFALLAANPAALVFLVPLLLLCMPVAMLFGFFYLLIKVLEKAQMAQRRRALAQIEAPTILRGKETRW